MKSLYGYPIPEDAGTNKVKPITHLKEFQKALKFLKDHLNDNAYKQRYLMFSLANETDIPTLTKTKGYSWSSRILGAICLRIDVRKIAQKYIGRKEEFVLSEVSQRNGIISFYFVKFDPFTSSFGYSNYSEAGMEKRPSEDDCKNLANDLQKVFKQSGWNVSSVTISVDEDNSGSAYGIANKFKYCYSVDVKI